MEIGLTSMARVAILGSCGFENGGRDFQFFREKVVEYSVRASYLSCLN